MKPRGPVSRFYDELAADYHLVYADWDASVARQGASLDRLIGVDQPASVLDCACGIGTQAIGLAARGHRVIGSDISAAAVGRAALAEMRRVLRDGGLLIISTRPYDEILRSRPVTTLPQVSGRTRTITFQVWNWHDDGRHYDLELFRLLPEGSEGDDWRVRVGRASYWALTQDELTGFVTEAGFADPAWHTPEHSGFFQPVLTATAPAADK